MKNKKNKNPQSHQYEDEYVNPNRGIKRERKKADRKQGKKNLKDALHDKDYMEYYTDEMNQGGF